MRKLIESVTESQGYGTVETFSLNNSIGRDDPTDQEPIKVNRYPTNHTDVRSWVTEYLSTEAGIDIEDSKLETGADGAIYYNDEDGYMYRFSLK